MDTATEGTDTEATPDDFYVVATLTSDGVEDLGSYERAKKFKIEVDDAEPTQTTPGSNRQPAKKQKTNKEGEEDEEEEEEEMDASAVPKRKEFASPTVTLTVESTVSQKYKGYRYCYSKSESGSTKGPCKCLAITSQTDWDSILLALKAGNLIHKCMEERHKEYYQPDTSEERCLELDAEILHVFNTYYVPSTKGSYYWTLVVNGVEVGTFCNNALAQIIHPKHKKISKEEGFKILKQQNFLFYRLATASQKSNNNYKKIERTLAYDKDGNVVGQKFEPTSHPFLPDTAVLPNMKKMRSDKPYQMLTDYGAFFQRQIDKNSKGSNEKDNLVVRVNNKKTYGSQNREVHKNHLAAHMVKHLAPDDKHVVAYVRENKKSTSALAAKYKTWQKLPTEKFEVNVLAKKWKVSPKRGQIFNAQSTFGEVVRSSVYPMTEWELLIVSEKLTYEPTLFVYRKGFANDSPIIGKLLSFPEGKKLAKLPTKGGIAFRHAGQEIKHRGHMAVGAGLENLLHKLRGAFLGKAGPNYLNSELKCDGYYYKKHAIVLSGIDPNDFSGHAHFIQYELGQEDHEHSDGDDPASFHRFFVIGAGSGADDDTTKAELNELKERLTEIVKFSTMPTNFQKGKRGFATSTERWKVVFSQPAYCAVTDYRSSPNVTEIVSQMPGLPFPVATMTDLLAKTLALYVVIIPLDRTGLVVRIFLDKEEDKEEDSNAGVTLLVEFGSHLILPATTHYTTFHRSSFIGSPHIRMFAAMYDTDKGEETVTLGHSRGNIVAGRTSPLGVNVIKGLYYDPKYDNTVYITSKMLSEEEPYVLKSVQPKDLAKAVSDGWAATIMMFCLPARGYTPGEEDAKQAKDLKAESPNSGDKQKKQGDEQKESENETPVIYPLDM